KACNAGLTLPISVSRAHSSSRTSRRMEIAAVRGKSSAVMPHVLTATAARLVQTERRIMQVRTGVAPAFPLTASHAICKLRDAVLVVLAQLIGLAAGRDTDNRIATSQR